MSIPLMTPRRQRDQTTLRGFTDQVDELSPPRHREQYEVFSAAIRESHEAAQLAYSLTAEPTTATLSSFAQYHTNVNDDAAQPQRSNETLGWGAPQTPDNPVSQLLQEIGCRVTSG